jgi:probable rRNA maturation factor
MLHVLIDYRCKLSGIPKGTLSSLSRSVVKTVAKGEDIARNAEFSISFVDDIEMRDLNRDYRNLDRTTDVLAFALNEGEMLSLPESSSDTPIPMGDVVISLETARRQADRMGHSLRREIATLLVHGTLHLIGYDHTGSSTAEKKAAKAMRTRQDALIDALVEQCVV